MATTLIARSARSRQVLAACISFCMAAVLLGSCSRDEESAVETGSLELTLDPENPVVGPSRLTLVIADPNGDPLTRAEVKIEGNMNHAGMVPVFADAVETEPGRYEAEIEFTMGGDWFLLVEAVSADGTHMSWKKDVWGVRRN